MVVGAAEREAPRYIASIELQSAAEFLQALRRAETLLVEGSVLLDSSNPVEFIMHGPEVHSLLRQNYADNREMVDLAARLSALGVIQIRACERWMGGHSIDPDDLHAFVGTVPWGAAEVSRLLEQERYVSF